LRWSQNFLDMISQNFGFLILSLSFATTLAFPAGGGLASLIGDPALTKARGEVVKGLNTMKTGLANVKTAAVAANNTQLAALSDQASGNVASAQAGVSAIAKNILAGQDPNSGDNPQGQVAAGIVGANSTVAQMVAINDPSNTAATSALTNVQSGLTLAINGGQGVLASEGKTLQDVLANSTATVGNSSSAASPTASAGGLTNLLGGGLAGLGGGKAKGIGKKLKGKGKGALAGKAKAAQVA